MTLAIVSFTASEYAVTSHKSQVILLLLLIAAASARSDGQLTKLLQLKFPTTKFQIKTKLIVAMFKICLTKQHVILLESLVKLFTKLFYKYGNSCSSFGFHQLNIMKKCQYTSKVLITLSRLLSTCFTTCRCYDDSAAELLPQMNNAKYIRPICMQPQ